MEIVLYDRMLHAIAECHRVDEVKDIRDKAMALEMYAKQASNTIAERNACDIRLRAERKVGQMLKDLQRATPQTANPIGVNGKEVMFNDATRPATKSEYAATLEQTGISRQTAHRYQRLAELPESTFEAALRKPEKPTTNGLVELQKATYNPPSNKKNTEALWLWGRMRDFERDGLFEIEPQAFIEPMTDSMRADVLRLIDPIIDFFNAIKEEINVTA
jgi:hypothetical protein